MDLISKLHIKLKVDSIRSNINSLIFIRLFGFSLNMIFM